MISQISCSSTMTTKIHEQPWTCCLTLTSVSPIGERIEKRDLKYFIQLNSALGKSSLGFGHLALPYEIEHVCVR